MPTARVKLRSEATRTVGSFSDGGTPRGLAAFQTAFRGELLMGALVVVAAIIYLVVVRRLGGPIGSSFVPWWSLVIVFFAAELYALNAEGGVVALSLHDAMLVFGFFLVAPGGLIAAQLAGALLVLVLFRRSPPVGVLFRIVVLAFGTSLAVVAFHAVREFAGGGDYAGWLAAFAGAAVACTASVMTSHLLATQRHRLGRDGRVRLATLALAGSVSSTSIALVAVELVRGGHVMVMLLILPFVGCAILLRAYGSDRRRLENVQALYESMRMVGRGSGLEAGVSELLEATRSLLDAEVARIYLLRNRRSGYCRQGAVSPVGETPLASMPLTALQEVAVTSALRSPAGVLVSSERGPEGLRPLLVELRLREAMVTALRGDDDAVVGVLLAGNRLHGGFGLDDLRLFKTFAGHAGVLLENDRLEESLAELRTLKEDLHHQAYHDALTDLPNRRLFAEHVVGALAEGPVTHVGVLFLDLDDFKTINDSLGHAAGDTLLQAVAGRVRGCVREQDIPARLGGDEFAVLARSGSRREVESIAERLVKSLDEPFSLDGREISVHTSVGIAYGGSGASNADDLLRNADVAMYEAKQSGKRRFAVYAPEMHAVVRRRHELVGALERAVERGEIDVHFQPIVDLGTRRLVGFEALARWDRPEHGLMLPGSFIPLADELGMMGEIGSAVLRTACHQMRTWDSAFPDDRTLILNVNLAPSELHDPNLARSVREVLFDTGLPARRLVLEITESGVMSNPAQALETMLELRKLGVSLSLDDFGTGHSSLAYLREFPLDQLKIAQPFVAGLPDGHVDSVFVDAMVRLASSLGLEVIAEGVESATQAAAVAALGCTRGQGYYFGVPLSKLGVANYLGADTLPQIDDSVAASPRLLGGGALHAVKPNTLSREKPSTTAATVNGEGAKAGRREQVGGRSTADEPSVDLAFKRLAEIEREERLISAKRQRVHARIDFLAAEKFGVYIGRRLERLAKEELELSSERRTLHAQIDRTRAAASLPSYRDERRRRLDGSAQTGELRPTCLLIELMNGTIRCFDFQDEELAAEGYQTCLEDLQSDRPIVVSTRPGPSLQSEPYTFPSKGIAHLEITTRQIATDLGINCITAVIRLNARSHVRDSEADASQPILGDVRAALG